MTSADKIKTPQDLVDLLNVSSKGTEVLLAQHRGASILAAKNKYKNGYAVVIKAKGGKYHVYGTAHYHGSTKLDEVIEGCRNYIEKYDLGLTL